MISVDELDVATKTGRKAMLVISDRARGQDARALRKPCLPI
jgi:hypothetical protein